VMNLALRRFDMAVRAARRRASGQELAALDSAALLGTDPDL